MNKIGCKGPLPHVGFNEVKVNKNSNKDFQKVINNDFYFVHSYGVDSKILGTLMILE